jgi:pilus assembly protein CpaF
MFKRRPSEGLSGDRLDAIRRRTAAVPEAEAEPAPAPGPRPAAAPTAAEDAAPSPNAPAAAGIDHLVPQLRERVSERIGLSTAITLPRKEITAEVGDVVTRFLSENKVTVGPVETRALVTVLVNDLIAAAQKQTGKVPPPPPAPKRTAPPTKPQGDPSKAVATYVVAGASGKSASRASVEDALNRIQAIIMDRIDVAAVSRLPRKEIAQQIGEIVGEILTEQKIQLNQIEQRDLVTLLLNEMLGLGPLEPLLADETITDIMVNGAKQVYVERKGKLDLTDIQFRDDSHVMNIATRIVTGVGRRVDESSPLVDARLADGSRVNIIIPPLAIDGPSISIRKFSKKGITLDVMARQGNISEQMATVLKIAARCRLNILISGGTGSGKTTLLNALSQMIDPGDRIVTIEDAAELQLQQPHVVRLETRPPNLEGEGEITMRDLVKNSLRMRPDRIILGEVRGSEAVDMLQAMNTGHEGSLGTIHANRPREALTRLENMIGLAGINLPAKAVRTQIASALDVIVQVSRMRDGMRRVTHVMEVVGMEGDVITTQDLFTFEFEGEGTDGMLRGNFKSSGLRPHFTAKAEYFGLDRALLEAM